MYRHCRDHRGAASESYAGVEYPDEHNLQKTQTLHKHKENHICKITLHLMQRQASPHTDKPTQLTSAPGTALSPNSFKKSAVQCGARHSAAHHIPLLHTHTHSEKLKHRQD